MSNSTLNIVDLCDEILLNILNKLNNLDVLYSCIGVNKKLDRLARDITFTQSINLVTTLSNEHHNSILDRFCLLILQRIQHNIEYFTLNSLSVDRILRIGNYSKLHKLSLVNLPIEMACHIFNVKMVIFIIHQTLNNLNDCICLLNGHLSQLHTLIVEIDWIRRTSMALNNTEIVSNLKCFSLISFRETIEYDTKIVPLLRHMSKLEKPTLSLIVDRRNSCIDGHHLVNDILSKMSHLHTFIFNIITNKVIIDEEFLPTRDNILCPLIEKGYNADCYTDYCTISNAQCHIYSLPFNLECMHMFTNKFPDGCVFVNVRHFAARLIWRPFEHEFLLKFLELFHY
ncbi:unnamed protein product [Adineta steineri]|uniref:F-box domain-containing protein n=1 Tax=Adineta steineri TaxID=433720 RepID=A0A813R0B0_9BILA|nr:unnamed protein product [Adineta steineri]CAF0962763.1 unnamed protein product [Adineta steineri]